MNFPGNPMQMSFNPMFCFGPNPFIGMMPNPPNPTVMGGNWSAMYNPVNVNNMNNRKLTVFFKTGKGLITTVFIDYGKTVNYLIQVYFKRMGKPELINKPREIGLIYNARLINFNESRLVEDFFGGFDNVTITVNDIGDLIGA